MNKIKKTLLLALSLAMSAAMVVACGEKGNGETSSSATSSSEFSSSIEDSSKETASENQSSEEESSETESESNETSSEEEKQTYSVTFNGDVDGAILSQAFTYQGGDEVEVVLALAEAYSQSIKSVAVSYTVNGGASVSVTLDEYDSFLIENASGDIVVTVTGIVVNEYKVAFYNGDEETYSVMVSHGGKLTEEQLATALQSVTKENQEVWGWKDAVDEDIFKATTIRANIATAIASADDLAEIEQNGNYFLTADVDFTGKEMIKFENEDNHLTGFQGIIDGRNYKITANGGDMNDTAILFWRLDNATIKDVEFDFTFKGMTGFHSGALCRQFVESTLENVTINVSYAQIGQAAVIGTFYGGTVKDCKIYVKSPSYDTSIDGIAALASSVDLGSWSDADSVVDGLEVHLPSNMSGNTVVVSNYICNNNADLTDEAKMYDYIEENVLYVYDMEEAEACVWINSVITPDMEETSQEAPMDYSVVYIGNFSKHVYEGGVVDYMWNYGAPFSVDGADISYYRTIRFAVKTDEASKEIVLGSNNVGEIGGIGATWTEIVMKRNAQNTWNIYKDGILAVEKVALEDITDVFSRKGVKNDEVNDFVVYLTNVQVIAKEGVTLPTPKPEFEGETVAESALQAGTISDKTAPKGYENVYSVEITQADMFGLFADLDITKYSELRFKACVDQGTVYLGADAGRIVGIETRWREVVVNNNNDGTWTVTEIGYGDTFTVAASNLKDVFAWTLYGSGTLYVTEVKALEKVVPESGLKEFGATIAVAEDNYSPIVDGVLSENTFDGVSVYEKQLSVEYGGTFGANFNFSAYEEIRFNLMFTGTSGLTLAGGDSSKIWLNPNTWYYFSLKNVDGVWQLFGKTNPEGEFVYAYVDGVLANRPAELDDANLASVIKMYNWGTVETTLYVTELRGVLAEVTPEPDPEKPDVTLWGTNIGGAIVGDETDTTAPEGYEKVIRSTYTMGNEQYANDVFSKEDISDYSEIRFMARFVGCDKPNCAMGSSVGQVYITPDWREIVLTQNTDGTWKVQITGYGDNIQNATASSVNDIFPWLLYCEGGIIEATELRGVEKELWGTSLGSAVVGAQAEETAPEGYKAVYNTAVLATGDVAWQFSDLDISGYSQLKFMFCVRDAASVHIGPNAGKLIAVANDWREVVITKNDDGTWTVTEVGFGDNFTSDAGITNLKDLFVWALYAQGGTIYATEIRGVVNK